MDVNQATSSRQVSDIKIRYSNEEYDYRVRVQTRENGPKEKISSGAKRNKPKTSLSGLGEIPVRRLIVSFDTCFHHLQNDSKLKIELLITNIERKKFERRGFKLRRSGY